MGMEGEKSIERAWGIVFDKYAGSYRCYPLKGFNVGTDLLEMAQKRCKSNPVVLKLKVCTGITLKIC